MNQINLPLVPYTEAYTHVAWCKMTIIRTYSSSELQVICTCVTVCLHVPVGCNSLCTMHFNNNNILRVHRQSFRRSCSPTICTMYCPPCEPSWPHGDLWSRRQWRPFWPRARNLGHVCPKFEGQTAGVDPYVDTAAGVDPDVDTAVGVDPRILDLNVGIDVWNIYGVDAFDVDE